ncbi:TPA: acyl carrier protein [Escherichia coli]|nr:acyl carrier protein [Escherichia coli]
MIKNDKVFTSICSIIAEAKGISQDDITPETCLSSLGLDSLDFVELMVLCKREFAVNISSSFLSENKDISMLQLCNYINTERKVMR